STATISPDIIWLQAPANRCFAPTQGCGSSDHATFSGPHADFRGCSRRDLLAVRSRQVASVIRVNRQGATSAVVVIQLQRPTFSARPHPGVPWTCTCRRFG